MRILDLLSLHNPRKQLLKIDLSLCTHMHPPGSVPGGALADAAHSTTGTGPPGLSPAHLQGLPTSVLLCARLPHSFPTHSSLTSRVVFGCDRASWTQFWTLLWLHLSNVPLSPTHPHLSHHHLWVLTPVTRCLTPGREKMVRLGENSVCGALQGPRAHWLIASSQVACSESAKECEARKRGPVWWFFPEGQG